MIYQVLQDSRVWR